jgi:predicted nucleotidyltransferase
MLRDEALRRLAAHREEIRAFGVTSLALFGSVARDEAGPESDVDLLIEFDPAAHVGLFEFVRIQRRLGEILGVRVDLVDRESLLPELRPIILAEAIDAIAGVASSRPPHA